MLIVKDIAFGYGAETVFSGVNLTVENGECVVVNGPSGSGKTTLLRCCAGLERPAVGSVLIDENKLAYNPRREPFELAATNIPAGAVSLVYQKLHLWPNMTIRENFQIVSDSSGYRELAEELEIERVLDRLPNQVSLGQAQRAALIRAVTSNPRYLLLDEATSALDHRSVKLVCAMLNKLRLKGLGILAVTHDTRIQESLRANSFTLDEGVLKRTSDLHGQQS